MKPWEQYKPQFEAPKPWDQFTNETQVAPEVGVAEEKPKPWEQFGDPLETDFQTTPGLASQGAGPTDPPQSPGSDLRPESSSWWRSNIVDPWKESGEQEKNEFALFDAFTGGKGTMGGFKDLVSGKYQFDQKQYDAAVSSNRVFNERRAANTPDRNYFERIIPATVGSARRMLAGYWEGKEEATAGALVGAGAAAVAGQLGPQVAIPEELVTVPVAAMHGAKYGVTFGSAKYWAKSGFGEIAAELAEKNVDPAIIAKVAPVGGIAYAAAEFLVSEVPGFPAFLKANPVVSSAMKKTALNLAKEYSKRVVVESVEETVQQFITDLSANLAADMQNSKAGKLLVEKVPIAEMMQRGATAFMESLGPSALMMAPGEIQIANQARKTSGVMAEAGIDPESGLRFEKKGTGRGKEPVIRNAEGEVIGQGDAVLKQASMAEGVRREQFDKVKARREQQVTRRNARNKVLKNLDDLGVSDDIEVRRAWLDPNMPAEEKVARLNDLLAAKDQISQFTEVEKLEASETVTQAVTEDPGLSEQFDEVLGFEQEVYQLMRSGLTEEDAVETLFDEQDAALEAEERAGIKGEETLGFGPEALGNIEPAAEGFGVASEGTPNVEGVEPPINTKELGTVAAEEFGQDEQDVGVEPQNDAEATIAAEPTTLRPQATASFGDAQYEKRDGKWFEAGTDKRTRDIRLVRSLENEVATPKEHSRKRRKKALDEIKADATADIAVQTVLENGGIHLTENGKAAGVADYELIPAMFRSGQSKKSRHAKFIAGFSGKNDSAGLPLDELVSAVNHALGNEQFDENSLVEYLSGFGNKAEELLDGRRKLQDEQDAEQAGSDSPQRAQSPVEEELPELFNRAKPSLRKKVPAQKSESKNVETTTTGKDNADQPEASDTKTGEDIGEPGSRPAGGESQASSLKPTALVKNPLSIADGQEVNTDPSEAQKSAENYKKAHVEVDGFAISIENPQGSVRRGVGPDGKAWESEMKADYGYFKGTVGYDKDHVDVFVAPGYSGISNIEQGTGNVEGQEPTASSLKPTVFIINQVDPKSGKFDEHKVVFGAVTADQAEKIYLSNYEAGWKGGKSVVPMSVEAFKEWVYSDAPKAGAVKKSLKQARGQRPEAVEQPVKPKKVLKTANVDGAVDEVKAPKTFKKSLPVGEDGSRKRVGVDDESDTTGNLEPDRVDAGGGNAAGQSVDDAGGKRGRRRVGKTGQRNASPEGSEQGGLGLSDGVAAVSGAPGNQPVRAGLGESGVAEDAAGSGQRGGGDLFGDNRVSVKRKTVGSVTKNTPAGESRSAGNEDTEVVAGRAALSDLPSRLEAQHKAEKTQAIPNDADNIRATLPVLLPEQQDDVIHAEARLFAEGKQGVMFTNGTGTGKTYTGLGMIKRVLKQGGKDILIVTPTDQKNQDWREDAQNLLIKAHVLKDTKHGGKGVTITTYANFYQNRELAKRNFDLIVYDESHKLSSSEANPYSDTNFRHKAISQHERSHESLARIRSDKFAAVQERIESLVEQLVADQRGERVKHRDAFFAEVAQSVDFGLLEDFNEATGVQKRAKLRYSIFKKVRDALYGSEGSLAYADMGAALDEIREIRAVIDGYEKRPKVVFLSASPFAYHKNVDYAEGYLFDYENVDSTAYNVAGGIDKILVDDFGYQMKVNKPNKPDANVNIDLMERRFHEKLKKEGAVRGRQLKLEVDYSREFIDVNGGQTGALINRAFNAITDHNNGFEELSRFVHSNYDHHYKNFLMESLKAAEAVRRTKKHLAMGRQVVLFHSYKNRPVKFDENPIPFSFIHSRNNDDAATKWNEEVDRFYALVPEIKELRHRFDNPLDLFRAEFGEDTVFINGDVSKKVRRHGIKNFNNTKHAAKVIVVQIDAGREGISLHDVEGDQQRALINLGLPFKPMDVIQSEGRIYRVGSKSNAIYEYLKLGLDFEERAFNQKISERSRTAENLAMGNLARNLEQALKDGYQNSTSEDPSAKQGMGGREMDARHESELSQFEEAKTFYFAKQKRTSRNKAQEGVDYFATPEPVGVKMVEWAQLKGGERGMEPSAGDGAIASWFPGDTANTFVEPAYELITKLESNINGTHNRVEQQTFEDLHVGNKYHGIVMNPPFGKGGKTAMEHLGKAFKHLYDGGRVVALIPEGPMADKRFDQWYESDEAKSAFKVGEISLPGVTFKRAGTGVKTRIVIMDKIQDEESSNQSYSGDYDLTGVETIQDLFQRLEEIEMPDRVEPSANAPKLTGGEINTAALATGLTSNRDFVLPNSTTESIPVSQSYSTPKAYKIQSFHHTKKDVDLYLVVPQELSRDDFNVVRSKAKSGGTFYQRKWGRTPGGFPFESEADAEAWAVTAFKDIQPEGGALRERSKIGFGFYSAVERAVEGLKQESFTVDQLLGQLRKMPGIKGEELDDLGLVEWLESFTTEDTEAQRGKARKVTKAEVLEFVRAGGVQFKEVEKARRTHREWHITDEYGEVLEVFGSEEEAEQYWDDHEDGAYLGTIGSSLATDESKFGGYQLPAGTNYREVLLTLPIDQNKERSARKARSDALTEKWDKLSDKINRAGIADRAELRRQLGNIDRQLDMVLKENQQAGLRTAYSSSHWDEKNVLAHIRLNDRVGPNGEKILFIEEIQSDWHQEGRKKGYGKVPVYAAVEMGPEDIELRQRENQWYAVDAEENEIAVVGKGVVSGEQEAREYLSKLFNRTEEDRFRREDRANSLAVPNAPFKKSWSMLAFKRVLKQAVDGGYDAVAWTPGEVQNDRYDLSKQVDSIDAVSKRDGGETVTINTANHLNIIIRNNEKGIITDAVSDNGAELIGKHLSDVVGKELAEKILDSNRTQITFAGEDLKIGGEGMKGFYDKILPKAVQKYVKKFGGKVGISNISTSAGFEINDFNLWAERNGHDLDGITSEEESLLMDQWQEQDKGSYEVWNLPITDSMRGEIESGQALYEKPGKLDPEQTKKYLEKRGVEDGNAAKQLQTEWDEISNADGAAYPARESGAGDAVARALVSPDDPQALAEALKSGLPVSSVVARFLNNETPNLDWKGMLVQTARDFASLLMPLRSPYVESVKVAYLDQHKRIISARIVSIGLIDTTLVDAQEIIRSMPKGTAGVILAHNHPSGDPTPSVDDIKMSRRLRGALNLAGVRLFDHVVTNGGTYVSMRENGMTKLDDLNAAVESPLGDVSKRRLPPAMSSVEPWERVARRSLKVVADEDVLNGVTKALRQADGDYGHAVIVNSINAIVGLEKIPLDMDPDKGAALIMRSAAEMGGNAFFLDWPVTHDKPANGVFVNRVRDLAENEMGLPLIDFMTLEKSADNVMREGIRSRSSRFVAREAGFQPPKKSRKIQPDTEAGSAAKDAVLDLNVALAEYEEAYKDTAPERKTLKRSVQAVAGETRSLKKKVERSEKKSLKIKDTGDKKLLAARDRAKSKYETLKAKYKAKQDELTGAVREGNRTLKDELKDQRGDINMKIRVVEEYIRHKNPAGGSDIMRIAAGKAHHELKKVLSPARAETRQKYLQEAIGNIDRIFVEAARRDFVQTIEDTLLSRIPKVGKNKVLQGGSLMPEQHETLGFIREAWKVRQSWQNDDIIAELKNEFAQVSEDLVLVGEGKKTTLTDEQIKRLEERQDRLQRKIEAFETYGDINGGSRSLAHVIKASKGLDQLIEEGRSLHRMSAEVLRAKVERDRLTAMLQFTGGRGIATSAVSRRKRSYDDKNGFFRALDTFDTWHQSFEWLLDKLSKFDTSTGILGGKFIRDYSQMVNQATEKRDAGVRKYEEMITAKAHEIFGEKDSSTLEDNSKRIKKTGIFQYNDEGKQVEMELSKNEAYKLWQWWQDESLRESFEVNQYTAETIQQIEKFVGPKVLVWAKWQLEVFYPDYYHTINPVYKRLWFMNMPNSKNYSPVLRHIKGRNVGDMDLNGQQQTRASMVNRSLKARTENTLDFELIDGDRVLITHIMEMEHFKAWALPMQQMNRVFRGSEVQEAIQQFHGSAALQVVNKFLDDFTRGGVDDALVIRGFDRFRAQFTKAVIGAKLPIFIKQLTSVPAFAMDIPLAGFAKGEAAFWKNPVKAFKTLMESDFMTDRYRHGHDRDIILAMQSSVPRTIAGKKSWSNKLMILTQIGDGAAIVVGGYAVYHYHYNKTFGEHATKHKKALEQFTLLSRRTQQDGSVMNLGHVQRLGSFGKLFTMFSTSPISYYRSVSGSVRNAVHGRGSKKEAMKRVMIGHFLLPMIFQFVANGFRWDDEDQLRAALLGSFNKLFAVGEILDSTLSALISSDIRSAGGISQTPLGDVAEDAIYALYRLNRELERGTFDMADMMFVSDKIASSSSKVIGLPYEGIRNQVKGVKAAMDGETDFPVQRALGFTPYAVDESAPKKKKTFKRSL